MHVCFNLLNFLLAGVVGDPVSPSSFGGWVSHVATNHVGALSFFIMDFFLFFSVAGLTVVQASQVCIFIFVSCSGKRKRDN